MKKILIFVGAIILAALIAAGSFWGGIVYQTGRVNRAESNFMAARGGRAGGEQGFPGGLGFPGSGSPDGQMPGNMGGLGTAGQVKAVDGNVLILSTAQDVTTVILSDDTQIQMTVSGTAADLQPGTRIMVTGEKDSSGKLSANQIRIIDGDIPGGALPPPAETEP